MAQPNQEVCTIRIMFPVQSDQQALDCKKQIKEILKDVSDVNIQFSLTDIPTNLPLPQK